MSNSQQQTPRALPAAAVDRLFARFLAVYGAQKVAAAWGNVDPAERNAVWSEALARFDLHTIGEAVRQLADDASLWPPTLPEFVDRCQRLDERPGRRLALPVPARTPQQIAQGREQMDRIKAMLRGAVKRMPVDA